MTGMLQLYGGRFGVVFSAAGDPVPVEAFALAVEYPTPALIHCAAAWKVAAVIPAGLLHFVPLGATVPIVVATSDGEAFYGRARVGEVEPWKPIDGDARELKRVMFEAAGALFHDTIAGVSVKGAVTDE